MSLEVILIILIIAILLLVIYVSFIHTSKKNQENYERKLIQDIKFENKLKQEPMKEETEKVKIKDHVEEKKNTMDIEGLLDQMQMDLEKQEQTKIIDFEQEQEETSIISYQELKKAAQHFIDEEEFAQEQSPISLKEVLHKSSELVKPPSASVDDSMALKENDDKLVHPVLKEKEPSEQETKKFHNTEFISPIYGKQEQKTEYPHIPVYEEKEEVLSVLEEEKNAKEKLINTKDNEDFLNELRNFRNQL